MKFGIIGGSGLDNPQFLENYKEVEVETPYGKASSLIITGKISGVEVCILARHGRKHEVTPSNVNNRGNIFALKNLGCTHILATTAVGSLREDIKPGDFVILSDLIDFTKHRKTSFYDNFEKGAVHSSLASPFSEELRDKLIESCIELRFPFHNTGTVITIEGPRFSTRAESNLFRQWNADVINMSTAPEAALAREAGIEYAAIAMSTDYDCWKKGEKDVSFEIVMERMKDNADRVKNLIIRTVEKFSIEAKESENKMIIKSSIRTIPNFPKLGIMFRDITTLMKNPEAMKRVIEILVERNKNRDIDVVAGIESRGFIFGAILAERLGKQFVPVRKPGKLPAETEKQEYQLEYGTDSVEIHKDAIAPGSNVLVIDDLLATSGTSLATCKLIDRLGGVVDECQFVIELEDLGGRQKLQGNGYRVFSIVKFKETEK